MGTIAEFSALRNIDAKTALRSSFNDYNQSITKES